VTVIQRTRAGRLAAAGAVAAVVWLAPPTRAQQPTPTPLLDDRGLPLPFGVPPYFPSDYPRGAGPFKAVMSEEPGLSEHVVYAPANLTALAQRRMPVVIWANGSCLYAGNRYRQYLTEVASHGYLVIAGGPMGPVELEVGPQSNPVVRGTGPGGVGRAAAGGRAGRAGGVPQPGATAAPPTARVTLPMLKTAIDWATAQNRDASSRFHARLDLDHIVSMGHSCGGVLALELAQEDARVNGLGVWFSGIGLTGRGGTPPAVDRIRGPVLIITGEASLDIGYAAGERTFEAIERLPVFYGWQTGLQHIGTFGAPNGGDLGVLTVRWLEWTTRGSAAAGRMFKGASCTLCQDRSWHVRKKRID